MYDHEDCSLPVALPRRAPSAAVLRKPLAAVLKRRFGCCFGWIPFRHVCLRKAGSEGSELSAEVSGPSAQSSGLRGPRAEGVPPELRARGLRTAD